MKIVNVMKRNNLIKNNISRYSYYIIRLTSRRKIKLLNKPTDLKNGKTKEIFDDRLFGFVYDESGWNNNCNCHYYKKWLEKNKDEHA